jgi:GNAT superfamily N-acetyltransferase
VPVRAARPEEAPLLTEIAHAAKRHWGYPEQWIEAWREALTLTPDFVARHPVFVAEEDGAVRGFYALAPAGGGFTLEHLWVRPQWIGTGAGRRLFEHAVATARGRGAASLEIDADPHAEAFYLHMGARRVSELRADMDGRPRVLPRLVFDLGSASPGEPGKNTHPERRGTDS